jgi:hypothetical protein
MTHKKPSTQSLRKLRTSHILKLTVDIILDFLNLQAGPNSTYTPTQLLHHILSACISRTSISQVSDFNDKAPTEGTIRARLIGLELDAVQEKINFMLKKKVTRTISKIPLKFAIDFNELSFYGEEVNDGDTRRSKAKKGTTRFFVYATIYVILRNKRYTLGVKYVRMRLKANRY